VLFVCQSAGFRSEARRARRACEAPCGLLLIGIFRSAVMIRRRYRGRGFGALCDSARVMNWGLSGASARTVGMPSAAVRSVCHIHDSTDTWFWRTSSSPRRKSPGWPPPLHR
jgi:hypothetical protein